MQFEEINISRNPEVIPDLQRLGVMATPALMIGDKLIVGFDREQMDLAISSVEKG